MAVVFVQIQCRPGTTYKVSDKISELEIHSEMYSTSGEYDLLIKIFVPTGQDIGLFIQDNLHGVDEIVRTHTTIAFSTIPPRNAS